MTLKNRVFSKRLRKTSVHVSTVTKLTVFLRSIGVNNFQLFSVKNMYIKYEKEREQKTYRFFPFHRNS